MSKTVFDLGAHLGEDSSYYLKRGYKVVAFECSPENIAHLRKRFAVEIKSNQLLIETRALLKGGCDGKLVDFFLDDISVWGTVHKDWSSRNQRLGSSNKTIKVETLDPKSIYEKYGQPFFMKIDIEGSDMDVLESLFEVHSNSRPKYVSIESSKTSWNDLRRELLILTNLGYTEFAAVNQEKIPAKTSWISGKGEKEIFYHERDSSGPFGDDLNAKWKSAREIEKAYRIIFLRYKFFGDDGLLAPRKVSNKYLRYFYRKLLSIFQLSPGWFDTHARAR